MKKCKIGFGITGAGMVLLVCKTHGQNEDGLIRSGCEKAIWEKLESLK